MVQQMNNVCNGLWPITGYRMGKRPALVLLVAGLGLKIIIPVVHKLWPFGYRWSAETVVPTGGTTCMLLQSFEFFRILFGRRFLGRHLFCLDSSAVKRTSALDFTNIRIECTTECTAFVCPCEAQLDNLLVIRIEWLTV